MAETVTPTVMSARAARRMSVIAAASSSRFSILVLPGQKVAGNWTGRSTIQVPGSSTGGAGAPHPARRGTGRRRWAPYRRGPATRVCSQVNIQLIIPNSSMVSGSASRVRPGPAAPPAMVAAKPSTTWRSVTSADAAAVGGSRKRTSCGQHPVVVARLGVLVHEAADQLRVQARLRVGRPRPHLGHQPRPAASHGPRRSRAAARTCRGRSGRASV